MSEIEWLEPWGLPVEGQAAAFERQLKRETSPQHQLFGQPVRLLATHRGRDDVLFRLSNGRVAEVHLTWRRTMEPDPKWPVTAIFTSLREWIEQRMRPDHQEWSEPFEQDPPPLGRS